MGVRVTMRSLGFFKATKKTAALAFEQAHWKCYCLKQALSACDARFAGQTGNAPNEGLCWTLN
jgi:hypothetical protein